MKYLITILAITFFGMATPTEEREDNRIYGVWRSMDNDFIQIWKTWDSEEVKFQRISSNRMLKAKGLYQRTKNPDLLKEIIPNKGWDLFSSSFPFVTPPCQVMQFERYEKKFHHVDDHSDIFYRTCIIII